MVKLIIVAILSGALAIGSEHLADHIDKGNVKQSEAIIEAPRASSISLPLSTRSVNAPALDTSDAD